MNAHDHALAVMCQADPHTLDKMRAMMEQRLPALPSLERIREVNAREAAFQAEYDAIHGDPAQWELPQ